MKTKNKKYAKLIDINKINIKLKRKKHKALNNKKKLVICNCSKKKKIIILCIISITLLIVLISICLNYYLIKYNQKKENIFQLRINENIEEVKKKSYENNTFLILKRTDCRFCGLFSTYSVYLGCVIKYIIKGYIPIVEVGSFSNIFNKFNKSSTRSTNPWELLFDQPMGYTLDEVKKNAKNIVEKVCSPHNKHSPGPLVFYSQLYLDFFHKMYKRYMPIKKEVINESNIIRKKLFGNSKNILGVLCRGTDYIREKVKGHAIPQTAEKTIEDVRKMDKKNKYDYFYLATEDNNIRDKFIKELGEKLKIYQNTNINYQHGYLGYNKNAQGINYQKTYLISIIILSKCIDIITSICGGAVGAYVFSEEGFRESIVYNLGKY